MHVNIEIVDGWGNERRLSIHFCGFFGPLVYGMGPMNSAQSVCASVGLMICSFVTLFSQNPFI